jgi:NADPH2:quinone reductase
MIPTQMLAASLRSAGGPEVIELTEQPIPVPLANEVLIRVHAAGINRPDLMQRAGLYPPPPGASPILGLEVAGTVVGLGAKAERHAIGAEVTALVNGGGYAQYCTVPETQCLAKPRSLSLLQAAALPETFFTVWANLFEIGRLGKNEVVLIHGGASGIGVAAIQLAKAWGAQVIVTAGTDDKCQACLKLGASLAINYRTQSFADEVLRFTQNKGVDVILDMVGAAYFASNIKCLNMDGRLVQIAVQTGAKVADLDLFTVMRKRAIITGSTLRPRTTEEKGRLALALQQTVWPWVEHGLVQPVIDRVFGFSQVIEAHRYLENGSHIGKVMLEMIT